jgi:hypothetical protein
MMCHSQYVLQSVDILMGERAILVRQKKLSTKRLASLREQQQREKLQQSRAHPTAD